jgi:hypothetical protein
MSIYDHNLENLSWQEPQTLLEHLGHIESYVEALRDVGDAEDAASETEELLMILRHTFARVKTRHNRLKEVWDAARRWSDGDSLEEYFRKSLAKYREEKQGV